VLGAVDNGPSFLYRKLGPRLVPCWSTPISSRSASSSTKSLINDGSVVPWKYSHRLTFVGGEWHADIKALVDPAVGHAAVAGLLGVVMVPPEPVCRRL
jgi:hypothetical protein